MRGVAGAVPCACGSEASRSTRARERAAVPRTAPIIARTREPPVRTSDVPAVLPVEIVVAAGVDRVALLVSGEELVAQAVVHVLTIVLRAAHRDHARGLAALRNRAAAGLPAAGGRAHGS